MKVNSRELPRRGGHRLQPLPPPVVAPSSVHPQAEEDQGEDIDFYLFSGRTDLTHAGSGGVYKGVPMNAVSGSDAVTQGFPLMEECELVAMSINLNEDIGGGSETYTVRVAVARWDGTAHGAWEDTGVSLSLTGSVGMQKFAFSTAGNVHFNQWDKVRAEDLGTGTLASTTEAWIQLGFQRQ
jgi:hypothetical protein